MKAFLYGFHNFEYLLSLDTFFCKNRSTYIKIKAFAIGPISHDRMVLPQLGSTWAMTFYCFNNDTNNLFISILVSHEKTPNVLINSLMWVKLSKKEKRRKINGILALILWNY